MKSLYILWVSLTFLTGCSRAEDFSTFHSRLKNIVADRNGDELAKLASPDLQTSFGPEQETIAQWLETQAGAWDILDKIVEAECMPVTVNAELPDIRVCYADDGDEYGYRMGLAQINHTWRIKFLIAGD